MQTSVIRSILLATCSLVGALPVAAVVGMMASGQRFPVSGKVTYNGEPLKTGLVNFLPEDDKTARGASGPILEDGSYTLTTQSPGDGAMGGKYKVAISAVEIDEKDKAKTQSTSLGGIPDQAVAAHVKRTNLIPIKYSGTDTSGLTATVGPSSTTFNFTLEGEMTAADQATSGSPASKKRGKR